MPTNNQDLELGLIGNCCISALVDQRGAIVWSCFPRFDGDPVFHALLGAASDRDGAGGVFEIGLDGLTSYQQEYVANTAILRTVLKSASGSLEITDFAPRFNWRGRSFRPQMLVRRVRPLSGSARVAIRVRPRFDYGRTAAQVVSGSNHISYVGPNFTLRLTTDAPIDYIAAETPFLLEGPIDLVLGPDETLEAGVRETARNYEERTLDEWKSWVNRLALPLEWQDAVIRAAITLKMCSYEPTGAIVAAMTTSIPEAPDSGRNWDYRYCWIRDAYFVVRALNSLSAVRTMERYFRWMMNVAAISPQGRMQPVYGLALEKALDERVIDALPGYRGMAPVRAGNLAYLQDQHDTYGHVILGAAQAFFDRRLFMTVGASEFGWLEQIGEQAWRLYDQPDAGMWELRTRARAHTSTAIMSWAGCDRLAKISGHLGLAERAGVWRARADEIRRAVLERCWSADRNAFVESFDGHHLDASALLMGEVGMIDGRDARFVATVEALERTLARGPHMLRYEEADDFGRPDTAFNVCSFWRVDGLWRVGRREEARACFEAMLATRNQLGLMSEDTDFQTGEPWGNFPQTYSMVGIINGAMRLSQPWESVV